MDFRASAMSLNFTSRNFTLLLTNRLGFVIGLDHRGPAYWLCIPRPIRTAPTLNSDSSSQMKMPLPAAAGA
jgi:hypothetical protein